MGKAKEKGKILLNGIIFENPLFVMLLGTCPALATTKSVESAIGMGLLFLIVLICSNVLISLLRKVIPSEIRIPAYIVIIASFVTIVKLITKAYLPDLYATLGVFISLIVVNCIVLGRAEAFASKHNILDSFLDGLGMGIGYSGALIIIAFIRELFGTGGFAGGYIFPITRFDWQPFADYSIRILTMPAGGFIVLAIVLGTISAIKNAVANKKKRKLALEKEKAKLAAVKVEEVKK